MRLHLDVAGDADAAEAWRRYTDVDAWATWAPQIQRVDTGPVHDLPIDDDGPAEGEGEESDRGVNTPDVDGRDVAGTAPVPRRIAAGLKGVVVGPVGVQVPFEVLSVDDIAMTWTWRVRAVLAELTLEHSVAPQPGRGCRTDLTISGPAPLVLGYVPLARLALSRLVRR